MQSGRNGRLFWPVLIAVVATDVLTKWLAVLNLDKNGPSREIVREWLRFTLVYNPGAAFGLHLGDPTLSRWVFMGLTVAALLILGRLYIASSEGDRARVASLALVCGGALGNLLDRVRSTQGVIDFIDVGVRNARWPTFNVADMAVSIGAFLLAVVLWAEDRPAEEAGGARVGSGLVSGELRHESGEAT